MIAQSEIEEFFKEEKLTYLSRLAFDKDLFPIIVAKCKRANQKRSLDLGIKWFGSYYPKNGIFN